MFISVILITAYIPTINKYVEKEVYGKIDSVINATSTDALGSNERLAIVKYSFEHDFGKNNGLGLGVWPFTQPNFLGFQHFGLSSIGSIISLCGIWFYLFLLLFYAYVFSTNEKKSLITKIDFIIVILITVALSIYTVLFISALITFWFALIFTVLNKCKIYEGES